MNIKDIILRPVLTEKTTNLTKENFYSFEVNVKANKSQIKNAVEKIFNVKVSEVKTQIRKGKTKRIGKKMIPKKTANKKIAFIKLKEGKIDIFPQA
ncbi:MAG: 50S ribosomal protein L23 [Patescibacteria group bacterium]|nr:MAG: 50S ribosomal protein L23 [Patescibacteria group bacterium]